MTVFTDTFFGENEKELLFEQLKERAKNSNAKDPYEQFINEGLTTNAEEGRSYNLLRPKFYTEDTRLEKHHILPRHVGGSDEASNLIKLSIKDHIFAHWLRWQLFNSENDKRAYTFRVSSTEERQKLQQELIKQNVQNYREQNLFRFNSDYQSEMGKRGGSKGGSANSAAQFNARQKLGLTYGRETGIGNQSSVLKDTISNFTLWIFYGCKSTNNTYTTFPGGRTKNKQCPDGSTPTCFAVVIEPKKAFADIARALDVFSPNCIKLDNISTMHKLITEESNRFVYGWKFLKTLTRSEVETGNFTIDPIPEIITNSGLDQTLIFYVEDNILENIFD